MVALEGVRMREKPTAKIRLFASFVPKHDWDSIGPEQIVTLRRKMDSKRGSLLGRLVTGKLDPAASITSHTIDLPGRSLELRVHRPEDAGSPLPLVIAFHGGGFLYGASAQDDWLNSHLAANLPAVVVAVDYRLAPEHPLPAAVDDARDVIPRVLELAREWGCDTSSVAVVGASAGATLSALVACHADELGLPLRAQVLINPVLDWTESMFDFRSMVDNADAPMPTPVMLRAARRLAFPASFDPSTISPLTFQNLAGLAPALILAAGLDPVEDQATAYADRLRAAGVDVEITRYPRAMHAFLSMPGLVAAARPARAELLGFLRDRLLPRVASTPNVTPRTGATAPRQPSA
jgi:acetyl esterase